eukprot:CCRYP_012185-RA/>CCRYP_012185-RA protein AED:0.16 eAED:0.16 QI:0/-1/0/1/-1/1/1/0/143
MCIKCITMNESNQGRDRMTAIKTRQAYCIKWKSKGKEIGIDVTYVYLNRRVSARALLKFHFVANFSSTDKEHAQQRVDSAQSIANQESSRLRTKETALTGQRNEIPRSPMPIDNQLGLVNRFQCDNPKPATYQLYTQTIEAKC